MLNVVLQPNAKKDEIIGVLDGHLKIKIKAPPIEGKANDYAIKFLAKFFDVPKSNVTLIKGQQGRRKVFSIQHFGQPGVLIAAIKKMQKQEQLE